MPRTTDIRRAGFIPIPKDMNKASWKIEITSNGTTRDVTSYLLDWSVTFIATVGLSNFTLRVDNNGGRYGRIFAAGDYVDIYYDYLSTNVLIRFRGYIDGVYDNLDGTDGYTLIVEGRDAPKSSTNEHFGDTHITLQFTARNNLDCWLGASGSTDSKGNYEDGILYNSGMIMKVYDTSDSTWKIYSNLSESQKNTLKAQTGYTQTHTNTYVEKSRLTMSMGVAKEGDYDFRIEYDSTANQTYFMVHPENAIVNQTEHITVGQNFISLNRYGKDTTSEANRVKEKGQNDGSIIMMRSKEDTTRQSQMWIKDMEETTSALASDDEVTAKATARLAELKEALAKGGITCCALPSLRPAEKVPLNIPYITNSNIKIKSFTISGGQDIEFNLDIQDRETRFEKIFKDRIDDTVNITPTDNPNGMTNGIVFNFEEVSDYSLSNCQIEDGVLSLTSGQAIGTCTTKTKRADNNITHCELRIKANQYRNCTYRVSNDGGTTWETTLAGELHVFSSTGGLFRLEITLTEASTGVSPEFDKVNFLYKP